MGVYLRVTNRHPWPAGYAGVDGLIAAVSQDLDDVTTAPLPAVDKAGADSWRTLFASDTGAQPSEVGFTAIGHDAALLETEYSVYSLVVHYLLNNRPTGTQGFTLNEYRLLDNRDDALRLIAEWENWRPANPGDKETLEPGDQIRPLAVYREEITS